MDQAEDIRRRLEARQTGKPYVAPPKNDPPSKPVFQGTPSPPVNRQPIDDLARQRKLEVTIEDSSRAQPVVIVDIRMKFWSMVVFMVKIAFAAIPATIIIALIWAAIFATISALLLDKVPIR